MVVLLIACGSAEAPKPAPVQTAPTQVVSTEPVPQGPPEGEQHPPIPADNPAWRDDRPGFRSNFFFYGERSWADVRMRVAGHIAAVERDRARLSAMAGKPAEAAQRYHALAERLRAMDFRASKIGQGVRDRLARAAERDGRLLDGIAKGAIDADLRRFDGGLAAIRAELLHWTLADAHRPSAEHTGVWMSEKALVTHERSDLALDGFDDFDDRHRLRMRLLDAYLDVVDPIGFSDPWGYWQAREIERQSLVLERGAAMSSPLVSQGAAHQLTLPPLEGVPRWQRASRIAAINLRLPSAFTVTGMGRLPTGDSLIDVAGSPGPMAIGKLEKLGLDDPAHHQWLTQEVGTLNQVLYRDPAAVATQLKHVVEALDAHGHGSRYYNIKAARNEAVRQLARAGAFGAAQAVLAMNRPLHHQDWACPNRDGILLAIEGRLLASAGDPAAEAKLIEARRAADDFWAAVKVAEVAAP